MKRIVCSILWFLWGCSCLLAQNRQLSPEVNVKGVFRKDYEEVKKGTPFVLQRVVKVKKTSKTSRTQAVLVVDGIQLGLPVDNIDVVRFQPEDKNSFWQSKQLSNGLISYYEKKGYQEELRREQSQEANEYLRELEQSQLFYEDAAIEDYLQCLLLSIAPEQMAVAREVLPQVRVLKSSSPDMFMLSNNTLLVSTGMLATLDSEDELYAMLSREVAHYVLDHAIITVNKNVARARRAEFWGAVLDGLAAATEEILYERYDYYVPGLVFAANDVVQALVNESIINRMGLDYSARQEEEADKVAMQYMELMGKDSRALASALAKINAYYAPMEREKLPQYASLPDRLERMGEVKPLEEDRIYLKKTSGVVSYEAAQQDYNKDYKESRRIATKNIENKMACSDDYLMVARSIMKLSNTPESNEECLTYLEKADETSKTENLNICKMKILLLLRQNKQMDAMDLLHRYQDLLNAMFQQPHSEEDARWISAEYSWADKLLERICII